MIDIETQVYSPIATALRTAFPGINVQGEYVREPSAFPHVSIVEADNFVSEENFDTSDTEKFASLMYEVNVYSNKGVGKKAECKSILNTIDQMMYSKNFIRTSRSAVPNLENATIYRLVARYEAKTDGTNIYRR